MNANHEAQSRVVRMSVEEARRVRWLRNRLKPLGELLDEGYLDTYRLEWAAAKAYDPRLKEAARVLLEWQKEAQGKGTEDRTPATSPALQLGIRLEDARSTPWPFPPFKGQYMGTLTDSRQLSLKDLVYAAENAWDERVQQAAIALLLVRLEQQLREPPTPAGPLRVVSPRRSYAEQRQLSLAFLEGAIGGGCLAMALAYIVMVVLRQREATRPAFVLADALASPEGVLGIVLAVLLVGAILCAVLLLPRRFFRKLDQRIEGYRLGREGEDRVVEKARRALDGDWVLFRNVVIPGRRRSDLDIVLVGPCGLWAVEVKALRGEYRNCGDTWERRVGQQWRPMVKSPSRQARDNAIALAEFLRADAITTYVSAAIAWGTAESQLHVENPVVAVWSLDRLEDELANLRNGRRLDALSQRRIVDKLSKLNGADPAHAEAAL
jgi:hypothetical protein